MSTVFYEQREGNSSKCCDGNDDASLGSIESFSVVEADDAALAREMYGLSVEERGRVFDDIHGVAQVHDETPDFVAQCLDEMDAALSKINKSKRKALDQAIYFRPSILNDKKFKLMFLRTDFYDAQKAAVRMTKYFEEKLYLFGDDKLSKDLTLDDLNEEDMERLNYIGCIVLPRKDQSGRPIWFFNMTEFDFNNLDSMYRCFWYQVMATLEDENAQLKGVIDFTYSPGNLMSLPASLAVLPNLFNRIKRTQEAIPCREATLHFGYDDPRVRFLLSKTCQALGKEVWLRSRAHYGSKLEIKYSLLTFGIVCDILSADEGSNLEIQRRKLQEDYIQLRRDIEEQIAVEKTQKERNTGNILYPNPNDVLVGKGRPCQEFSGNQRLLQLIEAQMDRYRQAHSRFEKTCIFLDIVKTVEDTGGRFLQKTKDGWKVAPESVAREKVAGAIRFRIGKTGEAASAADSGSDLLNRSSKRARYTNTP